MSGRSDKCPAARAKLGTPRWNPRDRILTWAVVLSFVIPAIPTCADEGAAAGDEARSERHNVIREFQLNYAATIEDLPAGQVRVWIPVPPSNDQQQVQSIQSDFPAPTIVSTERVHGNKILYFEKTLSSPGELSFSTSYRFRRREVRTGRSSSNQRRLTEPQRKLYLAPNTLVPTTGKPLELLQRMSRDLQGLELGRAIYDRVDAHVTYDKSVPGYGNGDTLWVCDSRTGNCTDFHSLFISLARARGLPARFEIGLSIPQGAGTRPIAGYHCWAWFHTNSHGWVPVDISEADKAPGKKDFYFGNLDANRAVLTTGRDINLRPRQCAPPLNYFVYPHVEVDRQPISQSQIRLSISAQNIPSQVN